MHTQSLIKYIPDKAVSGVLQLLANEQVVVLIKNERKTRHGDYRRLVNGNHQITINSNLNKYKFLITLMHEIAHLRAFKNYGLKIKPHGAEWNHTFKMLMLPYLNPQVFPEILLPILANHFKKPTASSDTDVKLALALKEFDEPNDKTFIFEIPLNTLFQIYNGRVFKKVGKRTKRYECVEVSTGKIYLFSPHAEIIPVKKLENEK